MAGAKGGGKPADGEPTYPLAEVVRRAGVEGSRILTVRAEDDAKDELGLDRAGVFRIVSKLQASDFYKSMPSVNVPGTYQDVYLPTAPTPKFQNGTKIYCKVQIRSDLIVISFKLK